MTSRLFGLPATARLPRFVPHPLLRGGHAQTLAGYCLPGRQFPYRAVQRLVRLPDGDAIVLHDDCPAGWEPGDRVVLLMHGLAGCHLSSYMVRIAGKLSEARIRTFRMDLRGCGAGAGLARLPYHAGRSEDALSALKAIGELCGDSPVCIVGFSISGNVVLKLLGEFCDELPGCVDRAVAVNPPIDLDGCARALSSAANRLYDRHFVKLLLRQFASYASARDLENASGTVHRPRGIREFDDRYTARVCGFGTADNYYAKASSRRFIPEIRVPTLILTARDDPLVPAGPFEELSGPASVLLHIADHGGHLGYLSSGGSDRDRRWMDWRIIDWATARVAGEWAAAAAPLGASGREAPAEIP